MGSAALLGIPLVYAGYLHIFYRMALAQGRLPLTSPAGEVTFWTVLVLTVAVGAILLAVALARIPNLRVIACGLYVVLMPAALLFVGLLVSCFNGDCL